MRSWRSWWVLAAAGLTLAACRTDGERGEAAPVERGPGAPGVKPAPAGVGAEEAATTGRVLAAVRDRTQAEVDAAKLAGQRASSPDVKDYAVRALAETQATLDALSDLVKAKKIDLDAAAVQNDPVLRADREAARETVDRLRTLSGTPFDAAYMTAERAAQAHLAHLAQIGPQASRDADVGNVLRTVGQQARDRMSKVLSILPKACGGERPGWGAG
jgi:predicted outer membrane protein